MRNIILASAAVATVGLGALFLGSSDSEVQAQSNRMSQGVAKCELDNLKNANSDAGAAFMLDACEVLNP